MKSPAPNAASPYLPALDGMRAISIMLVLISHAGLEHVVPGNLGVLIFFVISGFLITRQIIEEIENTGKLSLKNFFLRRVFRLFPAMLVYLTFFGLILSSLGSVITLTHVMSAIFYFANYYQVYVDYPLYNPVPILWSLSVEEHYYIVFPFVMIAFSRKLPALLKWLCVTVIAVLLWRSFVYLHCESTPQWFACGRPSEFRFHTTTTIFDCILYGSIAAFLLHYAKQRYIDPLLSKPVLFGAVGVLFITLIIRESLFRETLRFSIQSICVTVIMLNVLYGSFELPRKMLSYRLPVFIGRLSYSLYLFHFGTLITILSLQSQGMFPESAWVKVPVYFTVSFILAATSFYFVERPMLALRRRMGSRAE